MCLIVFYARKINVTTTTTKCSSDIRRKFKIKNNIAVLHYDNINLPLVNEHLTENTFFAQVLKDSSCPASSSPSPI